LKATRDTGDGRHKGIFQKGGIVDFSKGGQKYFTRGANSCEISLYQLRN